MPISDCDGLPASHWLEVKKILCEAIGAAGFTAELVSDSDDIGLIHRNIVQNLYDNPVIVCDVSGKNANVMFELGLRLAFDKPTVIVKDNATSYSFDTSPIKHIPYNRDLRYSTIEKFKIDVKEAVKNTYEAGKKSDHSMFLKHFGSFTAPTLHRKEVSKEDYMIQQIAELRELLLRNTNHPKQLQTLFGPEPNRPRILKMLQKLAAEYGITLNANEHELLIERTLNILPRGHTLDGNYVEQVFHDYLDAKVRAGEVVRARATS